MKHTSRAPWGRFFGEAIHARNFGYEVWGGDGEAGQPLGMGVLGQFSLAGNRVAALHLASREIISVNSNGIKSRKSTTE